MDRDGNYYYLVFYKDQFINVIQAKKIKLHSHIHATMTNGIRLSGNHPIISRLITKETFPSSRFNQLYKKLEQHYSPIETALILSFFDAFTATDSTKKLLKKTYYDFRRNGKMRKSLQVLYLLAETNHQDSFASDMIANMEFQRYNQAYQATNTLAETDPIYFEAVRFKHLQQSNDQTLLLNFYDQNDRMLDATIVRIYLLKQQFNPTYWNNLLQTIDSWNTEEKIHLLLDLYRELPHPVIEQELTSKLIGSSHHKEAISFLLDHHDQPIKVEAEKFIYHLQQIDPKQLVAYFHLPQTTLITISKQLSKQQLEKMVQPFIKAFLPNYTFQEIARWFDAFHHERIHFLAEKTLDNMETLLDDPDHQYQLGELYASFDQIDKAIDCFKWEMELNPTNTKAIQSVVNLYKKAGNEAEANTYQDLLIQTQKYG